VTQPTDCLLWSLTEPTLQASVNAALLAMTRHKWQPARILFNAGELPAGLKVPAGISVEEASNVTPRHFQVWPVIGNSNDEPLRDDEFQSWHDDPGYY
jgi:hypothetical protein